MEVRAIGQGGQNTFDTNKSLEIKSGETKASVETAIVNINELHTNNNAQNSSIGSASDEKQLDPKDIKKAVDKLNKLLEDDNTRVEYEMHSFFKNDVLIRLVDKDSGKVISELPPKKILDMVAKMCEMVGVLFDKKA